MITPSMNFTDANQISAQMELLEKIIYQKDIAITSFDEEMRGATFLIPEVAKCQLEIIEEFFQIVPQNRDFSTIPASLKQKLQAVKERYIDSYSVYLNNRETYIDDRRTVVCLGENEKNKLREEYSQKIDAIFSSAQDEVRIDENTNLQNTYKLLQQKIQLRQREYDQIRTEREKVQKIAEEHYSEYTRLKKQREDFLKGHIAVTDIYAASQIGNVVFIQKAINSLGFFEKKSTFLNRLDNQGFAPIHYATYNNHIEMLNFLLENKVPPSLKDSRGYQPLHWAAKQGGIGVTNVLIEHNAPINGKGEYDRTPLHMAVYNMHLVITMTLLKQKADVNAQTTPEDGCKTPLHEAVNREDLDMVKALLTKKKLNVMLKDSLGFTPLYYAVERGLVEIARLILRHSTYQHPNDIHDVNHPYNFSELPKRRKEDMQALFKRMFKRQ